jgi:hypothetical protein
LINSDGSFTSNQNYVRLRGVTWRTFKNAFAIEGKAIDYISTRAKTADEFEELANDLEWPELNMLVVGFPIPAVLDLGIASVVFALYAFKCLPVTSCRGHPAQGEEHPLVVFFTRLKLVPIIVDVADSSGVGICNQRGDLDGALMVYGRNILDMRKFALGLQQAYPASARVIRNLKKEPLTKPSTTQVDLQGWTTK